MLLILTEPEFMTLMLEQELGQVGVEVPVAEMRNGSPCPIQIPSLQVLQTMS